MFYKDWINKIIANKSYTIAQRFNKKGISRVAKIYLLFPANFTDEQNPQFYIGATKGSLDKRYREHIRETQKYILGKESPTKKLIYFARILEQGMELKIIELNNVPVNVMFKIEHEWIIYLKSRNFPLLNGYDVRHKL